MKAKKILHKLDYVPRWIWYVGSLFVGGPVGPLAVYIVFHVLQKAAEDQAEEDWEQAASYAYGGTVVGEDYTVTDDVPVREASKEEAWAEGEPIDPDAGVEEVVRLGQLALRRIREANDRIPDPALSEQIDSIEESCRQILSMLEQRPELLPQLRTFLRYYLPTTLKLLDARAKLDKANTPKAREVRGRISRALAEVDRAFKNQVAALDEYRFVDLESEMDVLSEMLRSDGLLAEEEEDPIQRVVQQKAKQQAASGH